MSKRRKPEPRYVWDLDDNCGGGSLFVVGTSSQVQAYCEKHRLYCSGYYNLDHADLDNPFTIIL